MTSISVAPSQATLSSAQSSNASSSSTSSGTRSFASHLKESSNEDAASSTTEPTSTKRVPRKDEKESQLQKQDTATGILSVPVTTQQVQDPRPLLLSWQKSGSAKDTHGLDNASGEELSEAKVAGTAVQDTSNTAPTAAAPVLQKGPVAFSVALPKTTVAGNPRPTDTATIVTSNVPADKASQSQKNSMGSKQHSDTADSGDSKSFTKTAALEDTPKAQTFTHAINAVPAPATVVTAVQQSQHTPYSTTHLGRATATPAAAEVVQTTDLPPTPVSRPPQSIDLKMAGENNSQVDVRVSQRAGDVQVTVRTPDGDLAQSLKQHLPELSDRLTQSGVHSDIWHPGTAQASADTASNQESWNSDESQAQQQQHQQRNPNGQSNQPQEESNGSWNWLNEFNNAEKEDH